MSFCELLADRAYRYRHALLEQVDRARDHRAEHDDIVHAVLDRRPEAVTLLQNHYQQTVRTLLDQWQELA